MALKPRINIYDVDLTTITGAAEDSYDVAFIPGFTSLHLNDEIVNKIDTDLLKPHTSKQKEVKSKTYDLDSQNVYQYNMFANSVLDTHTGSTVTPEERSGENDVRDDDAGKDIKVDGKIKHCVSLSNALEATVQSGILKYTTDPTSITEEDRLYFNGISNPSADAYGSGELFISKINGYTLKTRIYPNIYKFEDGTTLVIDNKYFKIENITTKEGHIYEAVDDGAGGVKLNETPLYGTVVYDGKSAYTESDFNKYFFAADSTADPTESGFAVFECDGHTYELEKLRDVSWAEYRTDNCVIKTTEVNKEFVVGAISESSFNLHIITSPYHRDYNAEYVIESGTVITLDNDSNEKFYQFVNGSVAYEESSLINTYYCFATMSVYGFEIVHNESGKKFENPISLDQSVKFTDLTTFKKAVGSSPLMKWLYVLEDGRIEYSLYSPIEFAQQLGYTDRGDINKYLKSIKSRIIWVDTNWIYAAQLLYYGLPIFYNIMSDTSSDSKHWKPTKNTEGEILIEASEIFHAKIQDMYAELSDKGEYDIKYITTGTFGLGFNDDELSISVTEANAFKFPFYEKSSTSILRKPMAYLVDVASYRKDALVLLDAPKEDCLNKPLVGDDSVYEHFESMVIERDFVNMNSGENFDEDEQAKAGRRASNVFPWFSTDCIVFNDWKSYRNDGISFVMPGSYAYLISLADSLKKYESASWESIAGVTRALIPNFNSLYVNERLSNAVADYYNRRNEVGINAITNIRPYGYAIWGNRTLCDQSYFAKLGDGEDGLVASSFVDIMSMVCNVNKVAYRACKNLMFEKDNDKLWVRFTLQISPYLDNLQIGGALKTYTIQKEPSEMRGQLVAKIILWSTYSVENFDVSIVLRDSDEE